MKKLQYVIPEASALEINFKEGFMTGSELDSLTFSALGIETIDNAEIIGEVNNLEWF